MVFPQTYPDSNFWLRANGGIRPKMLLLLEVHYGTCCVYVEYMADVIMTNSSELIKDHFALEN